MRKKIGLVKNNKISTKIIASREMIVMLDEQKKFLSERTNSKDIEILEKFDSKEYLVEEFKIKNNLFKIYVKHI